MSFSKKMSFLIDNPYFPIKFIGLSRELFQHKRNEKQTWIFQCDYKGHYPYLDPYYQVIKRKGGIEAYFTFGYTEDGEMIDFLISKGIPKNKIIYPIDLVAHTNWDVYLSPTEWGNVFPRNKNTLRVQLFHTLADKGLEYGDELLNFNVIFASGDIHNTFMDKYVFSKHPWARDKCKVLNIGYAKIDCLFNGTYNKDSIKEHLEIDPEDKRKIIV